MPTFNMAAQTPNGQPTAAEAVYSNGIPQTYPSRMFSVLSSYPNKSGSFICPLPDALHLSIPAQGLPNGDAALPHAAYPGMQPYPGVGKSSHCLYANIIFGYKVCV
jgi:CUG-BP- and ETR3-like factor